MNRNSCRARTAQVFIALAAAAAACGPVADLGSEFIDPADQRINHICQRASDCGGVINPVFCSKDLKDAIDDGHISDERAAACGACVSENDCYELVDHRDCDRACRDVSFIEDLHTTRLQRAQLCTTLALKCGTKTDVSGCATSLRNFIDYDYTRDEDLSACIKCVLAATKDGGGSAVSAQCEQAAEHCLSSCTGFSVVASALETLLR